MPSQPSQQSSEELLRGRISRLDLFGAFKDFSAVVGPNGAGKSNFMDAVSFAVGVQSKDLRGRLLKDLNIDGSTTDDGTEERSASVTLVYECDGEETKFTRSIKKDGVDEYRIDGKVCKWEAYSARLKLLGVLTQAHTGFLVFQGYVAEFASKSPAELTKLCEEISGSGELKAEYERLEAEKKQAEENQVFNHQKKQGHTQEKGCSLHVLLSPASVALFEERMTKPFYEFEDRLPGFQWIGQLLGGIDVKRAQGSCVKDGENIVGEVAKLEGGMGATNSNVMGALRGWLTTEAKALLAKMPEEERGASVLIENVAAVLGNCGRLAEAEVLKRECLAGRRAKHGLGHPRTLVAVHNLAQVLSCQRRYAEAEQVYREAVEAKREVSGNEDLDARVDYFKMCGVGNLGQVLLLQGKLDEAEPLCVEATAWFRANKGPQDSFTIANVGVLVDLRRQQGRLAEAEEELGSVVADARAGLGPQSMFTLITEARAARLKHAQPGCAAAGAAELRAVVERMVEFLGAAQQDTVDWQEVLDEMEK